MISKKKLFTDPKVKHYEFDLSKEWYVVFYYRSPISGRMQEFRRKEGVNHYQTQTERVNALFELKKIVELELNQGQSPFNKKDRQQNTPAGGSSRAESQPISEKRKSRAITAIRQAVKQIGSLHKLRRKTIQGYTVQINHLIKWLESKGLDNITLSQFTSEIASQYLENRVNLKTDKEIHGKTLYNIRNTLNRIFKFLVERQAIEKSPFELIKVKKTAPTKAKRAFRKNEITALDKAMKAKHYELWVYVQIMCHCLLRSEEIRQLRIKDIDLDSQKITVSGDVSKNRQTQIVVIPDAFISTLTNYINSLLAKGFKLDSFLFSSKGKTPKAKNHFYKIHKTIQKQLGLCFEDISVYSWKHTGAVLFYQATKDIVKLKQQLRHSDLDTTFGYLHSLGAIENVEYKEKFPKTFSD